MTLRQAQGERSIYTAHGELVEPQAQGERVIKRAQKLLEVAMGRSLGLDVGDKWIGVALSDPMGILASPCTIIERQGDASAVAAILDIVRKQKVARIIVGLPRSMDGSLGEQAAKVQAFVEMLSAQTQVPIEFRDERLTTVSAKNLMRTVKAKKGRQKTRQDAIAAAIILQSYLEERQANR